MSSYPTPIDGTQQRYVNVETMSHQSIQVPSSWFGVRSGGYRVAKRAVTVLGTIEVTKYGHVERVKYGRVPYNGWIVFVVEDGTMWRAVDRKPVNGCEVKEGQ
jgi:hypothetical protein